MYITTAASSIAVNQMIIMALCQLFNSHTFVRHGLVMHFGHSGVLVL